MDKREVKHLAWRREWSRNSYRVRLDFARRVCALAAVRCQFSYNLTEFAYR